MEQISCPTQRKLLDEIASSLSLDFDQASLVVLQGWNWMFTHWAQYRSIKAPEDESELMNIVAVWYGDDLCDPSSNHPNFRASFDSEFVSWVDSAISAHDDA